ncbi:MAG: tetratricopeptide repeat protein, partial [Kiritimatiellia bacterium]
AYTAHTNLGTCLLALGEPRVAIACHMRALALKPDSPSILHNLAEAHAAIGELDRALELAARAEQHLKPEEKVLGDKIRAAIARYRTLLKDIN